jgi:hypothetical protein
MWLIMLISGSIPVSTVTPMDAPKYLPNCISPLSMVLSSLLKPCLLRITPHKGSIVMSAKRYILIREFRTYSFHNLFYAYIVNKEVKKARLYITTHGVYEAELNGGKVGDEYFAPGFTTYPKL